jgi:cold shock CspA family protein
MYGKDIFVMKSKIPGGSITKGAVVQFAVVDGLKGPEADAVKLVPGIIGALQPGWSKPQQSMPQAWAQPMQPPPSQMMQQMHSGGGGGPPSFSQGQPFYYGTVKSFNEEKGWGHITCPQTQSMYGKDMFVMRSALVGGPIKPGDNVAFFVQMGMKGPEALNVKVLGLEESEEAIYEGTIKQFAEDKGWGFIQCEETHQLYNKDIFIHRNELNGYVPAQGEAVQFAVKISNQGRPEATRVNFGPGRYAAVRGGYPQAAYGGRVAPF